MAELVRLSVYRIAPVPNSAVQQWTTEEVLPAQAVNPRNIRSVTALSAAQRNGIPRVYAKVILNDAAQTEYLTAETVDAIVTAANL